MAFPDTPDSALVTHLRPSPNFGARKDGKLPGMVVLHYTGMPAGRGMTTAERAIRWLENPASQVSAHYVVDEDGAVIQMVAEADRAWHAGVSYWAGEYDINSVSIGIEIAHPGHWWDLAAAPDRPGDTPPERHPGHCGFPVAQIDSVIRLTRDLVLRHGINPKNILAHSDIAPARKQDPGEKFPWNQLSDAGLGFWISPFPRSPGPVLAPGDSGKRVRDVQGVIFRLGYDIEPTGVFDEKTRQAVVAFQRHWRPERIDGMIDISTEATLLRVTAGWEREQRRWM